MQSYSDLLERVDGADRLSRKRIERMKEGLEEDLERLKSRKDDMLTIAEIGVDQIIVDEMQEFRYVKDTIMYRLSLARAVNAPVCEGCSRRLFEAHCT